MKVNFKSLYDLEHGHIIFPSELIANAKLPNYEYVKFNTGPDGLIVECACFIGEDNAKAYFNYYFDKDDKLLKLISFEDNEMTVLFDRTEEVAKLRNKLLGKALV